MDYLESRNAPLRNTGQIKLHGPDEFEGMRSSFYLYTADVDALYADALEAGAASVLEPADMDYGDRQAGVTDPEGNYWWISMRLAETDYD